MHPPSRLSDVIRRHKERLDVSSASDLERQAVTGAVDLSVPPKGMIYNWCLIALRNHVDGVVTLHVVGQTDDTRWIVTSDVRALASDTTRVSTENSSYVLGPEMRKEPGPLTSDSVARAIVAWGYDERFDLGIGGADGLDDDDLG